MSNNVNSIGPSKVAKIFAPLVIGSALAFGGKVNATEIEKPLPDAQQTASVQVEQPTSEAPKTVNAGLDFRLPIGYIFGATMGHILQRRRDEVDIKALELEVERLKKLQKAVNA